MPEEFNMHYEKISRIEVSYMVGNHINKAIYELANETSRIRIPKFPDNAEMTVFDENMNGYTTSFAEFGNIASCESEYLPDSVIEELPVLFDGENMTFSPEFTDEKPPVMTVSDVTEAILLGFPVLSSDIIDDTMTGIWSHHGDRIFEFNVSDIPLNSCDISANVAIKTIEEEEIVIANKTFMAIPCAKNKSRFLCSIDTDWLGGQINSVREDKRQSRCGAELTIEIKRTGDCIKKETYILPFNICVNNSCFFEKKNKYLCIDKNVRISIDFGTSSTCVAKGTGIVSMVCMSPDEQGKTSFEVYENPTNIKLFDWEAIRNEWNKKPNAHPVLMRAKMEDRYNDFSDKVFEYGHDINGMIPDKRNLDATITELKMLPKLIDDGFEPVCIPYNAGSARVPLTYNPTDREKFNPISFYAYLLGRAINHPNGESNKYYTRYSLTFPVKFTKEQCGHLKESIREGLRRSMPISNDANIDINIEMTYAEPLACAAAACNYELSLDDDDAVLFGVFDFGGGTVDFAYGLYRNADEDTEGYAEALEFLGSDGDAGYGGEDIIKKITYWILTDENNREIISEKNIVFEKPADELDIAGYGLYINHTQSAKSNTRLISEEISRKYFKSEVINIKSGNPPADGKYKGTMEVQINGLIDVNGDTIKEVSLKVDFDELEEKVNTLIKNICMMFKNSMESVFNKSYSCKIMEQNRVKYNPSTVKILMAGNASRHPMVKECLTELFSKENVQLIGDSPKRTKNGIKYEVTPKTAVAIGQLKLGQQILVRMPDDDEETVLFGFYVSRLNAKDIFELLIERNDTEKIWKRVSKINNCCASIYYSTIYDTENSSNWKPLSLDFDDEDDQKICYIRSSGVSEIEYIALPPGEKPDDADDSDYDIYNVALL